MTVDDFIDEGLGFLKAFPSCTRGRLEDHLKRFAAGDTGPDFGESDDVRRVGQYGMFGMIGILIREVRINMNSGKIRKAMRELEEHMSDEARRMKKRRNMGL